MKLSHIRLQEAVDVPEGSKSVRPSITWRQNGDKSWTIVVDYHMKSGHKHIHSNKNRSALDKIIKDRYGARTVSKTLLKDE